MKHFHTVAFLLIYYWTVASSSYILNCDEKNNNCKAQWQIGIEIYPKYELKQSLAIEVKPTQKNTKAKKKLIYRNNYFTSDLPSSITHNTNYKQDILSYPLTMLLQDKQILLVSNEIHVQYNNDTQRNTNSSIENKTRGYEWFAEDYKRNSVKRSNGSVYLPTDIQKVKKPMMRRSSDYRNRNISYQSLCPIKRAAISLQTEDFDYRPNHYIEVTCANRFSPNNLHMDDKNKICTEAGFSCIQLNRTIHFIRRNKSVSNECWDSEIRIVPSGCECMWPKHYYGDILAYHESHKRLTEQLHPLYLRSKKRIIL